VSPPSSAEPPQFWRVLGTLLPRSIRELVYEPSCLDLWREHCRRGSPATPLDRGRLAARFSGRLFASLWYSLPRYFVNRGRTTRLGKATGMMLRAVAILVVLLLVPWIIDAARSLPQR